MIRLLKRFQIHAEYCYYLLNLERKLFTISRQYKQSVFESKKNEYVYIKCNSNDVYRFHYFKVEGRC